MKRLTHKARYQAGYKANRDVAVWECIDKLGQLEDLEEQEKLLKLPCAVGDKFYCIWRDSVQNPIQRMQVKRIEIRKRGIKVYQMEFVRKRGCTLAFYDEDFGKIVFLKREEAEAALKALES